MKKKIILLVLALSLPALAYWLYSASFIEITVPDQQSRGFTYRIVNQQNKKTKLIKDTGNTVKVRVFKGSYEIEVNKGGQNFFALINTPGRLKTAKVEARLSAEKDRQFIGDNPAACMSYINGVLISYNCGGAFEEARIHMPATSAQPTYTLTNPNVFLAGFLGGIVNTSEGSLALIRELADDKSGYFVHRINQNLQSLGSFQLPDLSASKLYFITNYKNAFAVYDTAYNDIFYYASVRSKPERVSVSKPQTAGVKFISASFQDNAFVKLYTNEDSSKDARSEVIVSQDNRSRRFVFDKVVSDPLVCGKQKLCVLTEGNLELYDIESNKPEPVFKVLGVQAIYKINGELLVVKNDGILDLDIDRQIGAYEYSLGSYKFCGLQKESAGYFICLINSRSKKVALYIDRTTANTDNIDKKIDQLQKLPEVTSISTYANFIFISPELGELVYNKSIGGYSYDPSTKQVVNQKINQEIVRVGLDRRKYTIINTSE